MKDMKLRIKLGYDRIETKEEALKKANEFGKKYLMI